MLEFDLPPMIEELLKQCRKRGPYVLEVWDCTKCGVDNFEFHPFLETLECGNCGHRIASKVPLYLSIREKAVDER